MIPHEIREKLKNIVAGIVLTGQQDNCSTIRNLLVKSFGTSPTIKSEFESRAMVKERQKHFLKAYSVEENISLASLPTGCQYLTHGGEAKVYLSANGLNVIKVNDAVYYATWTEYFDSLLIHNLLFPNTAYRFLGFLEASENLSAVVEQPYVQGEQAELTDIGELLTFNGFTNTKRQDYYHKELNLLLEDMHDENVIRKEDALFFIDTVFYVLPM